VAINQETRTIFTKEISLPDILNWGGTAHTFENNPMATVRRVHYNDSESTQAYSAATLDPRVIRGLTEQIPVFTPEKGYELDDELRSANETIGTSLMPKALLLEVVGGTGVTDKCKGQVLGWVEFVQQKRPAYWRTNGFFNYPDDTLMLELTYFKRFFNWPKNDATTHDNQLNATPDKLFATVVSKDSFFAHEISQNYNYANSELTGVMLSGIRQGIQLLVHMENTLSAYTTEINNITYPTHPRKIVFTAAVLQSNSASAKLLAQLGFTKHPQTNFSTSITSDIWYYEV